MWNDTKILLFVLFPLKPLFGAWLPFPLMMVIGYLAVVDTAQKLIIVASLLIGCTRTFFDADLVFLSDNKAQPSRNILLLAGAAEIFPRRYFLAGNIVS
jgi:hypothetical protein